MARRHEPELQLAGRTGESVSAYPAGPGSPSSKIYINFQVMSALDSTYRISIQCAYPRLSISIRVLHPKLILLESLQSCYTPAILSCRASPLQRRWCPVSGLFKPREGRLVSHGLLLLKTGPIEEIIYLIWIRKANKWEKKENNGKSVF